MAHVEVKREGKSLFVRVLFPRIDGENFIVNAVKEKNLIAQDIELVEIDLDAVEYLNSLGITEFVNIHRMFTDITRGKTKFRFTNVDRKVKAILELVEVQKIAEIISKTT